MLKRLSYAGEKANKVKIIFSAILQPAGQTVLLSDINVKVDIITAQEEGQTLRSLYIHHCVYKVPLFLSKVFCFQDTSSNVVN